MSAKPDQAALMAAPWFLLNQLLAGIAGYICFGWPGLVGGATLIFALDRLAALPKGWRRSGTAGKLVPALRTVVVRPILMAAGIVAGLGWVGVAFVYLMLTKLAGLTPAWIRGLRLPSLPNTLVIARPIRNLGHPDSIAMILGNVVILLILGCILIGMQVALYAALIATPIWLFALIVLAIGGAEPDAPHLLDDEPVL